MRVVKATLKVFGKELQWCGPSNRWKYPGGWLTECGSNWIICCHGVTAIGKQPEDAIRKLLVRVTKVQEAIG